MTLHFEEYGNGQPLLILHGLLGSLDNWHTLSRKFGSSFRVLAVDQRNHGRSPHSDTFTYEAMAGDLLELLDRLEIPSAHVLGHSMGGKTAMEFALTHPERVDKLIVVDIAPRSYPPLHDEILDAMTAVDLKPLQTRQQVDAQLAVSIHDPAVRQFLMKNLTRDESGRFRWRANLPVFRKNYRAIAREIDGSGSFSKPVLFIKSTKSGYVLDSDTPAIKKLFPGAQITGVEAGHWIHADAPGMVADIVLNFLLDPQ